MCNADMLKSERGCAVSGGSFGSQDSISKCFGGDDGNYDQADDKFLKKFRLHLYSSKYSYSI